MKKLIGLFLLALLLMTTACSPARETAADTNRDEAVIALGIFNPVEGGYDPCNGYGLPMGVPDIFHPALLKFSANLEIEPDLATDYQISPDGLTYTFQVRKDARFADGTPLTARDVVFTYLTAQKSVSVADLTMLAAAKAIDDYTVVFSLNKPWSAFLYNTAMIGIVPEHLYSKDYGTRPTGAGPWKVTQFDKGQQLILEPNEYYYGPKPKLKKVTIMKTDSDSALAMAKSGQLDFVMINAEYATATVPGMHMEALPSAEILGYNLPAIQEMKTPDGKTAGHNVTSDIAIRKALNIGIDRTAIIKNALNGLATPITGRVAPTVPWYNPEASFPDNRVEEAQKLLTDAGWIDTDGDGIREKNGQKAEIVINARTSDIQRYNLTVALADNAKKLGIRIIPKAASWEECKAQAMNTPTCWLMLNYTPYTLYQSYHSSQIRRGWSNQSSYANPAVDAYIEQALAAKNGQDAIKFWQQAQWDGQNGLREDYPELWIAQVQHVYLVKDRLDFSKERFHGPGQGMPAMVHLPEWFWK